jgi:copper chaperone CopZ
VIETIRFPVRGMTCSSCVSRITRALRRLDGVEQVRIDLRAGTGTVAAIAAAGYGADLDAAVSIPTVARPGFGWRLVARLRS